MDHAWLKCRTVRVWRGACPVNASIDIVFYSVDLSSALRGGKSGANNGKSSVHLDKYTDIYGGRVDEDQVAIRHVRQRVVLYTVRNNHGSTVLDRARVKSSSDAIPSQCASLPSSRLRETLSRLTSRALLLMIALGNCVLRGKLSRTVKQTNKSPLPNGLRLSLDSRSCRNGRRRLFVAQTPNRAVCHNIPCAAVISRIPPSLRDRPLLLLLFVIITHQSSS
jgi:hypothetical protein